MKTLDYQIAKGVIIFWFTMIPLAFFAWLTHVWVCIKTDQWAFLIAGAIAFPVAVFHGWYIWLSALFG